eukprot:2251526-Pyramimonas_sp.AAC.1
MSDAPFMAGMGIADSTFDGQTLEFPVVPEVEILVTMYDRKGSTPASFRHLLSRAANNYGPVRSKLHSKHGSWPKKAA